MAYEQRGRRRVEELMEETVNPHGMTIVKRPPIPQIEKKKQSNNELIEIVSKKLDEFLNRIPELMSEYARVIKIPEIEKVHEPFPVEKCIKAVGKGGAHRIIWWRKAGGGRGSLLSEEEMKKFGLKYGDEVE